MGGTNFCSCVLGDLPVGGGKRMVNQIHRKQSRENSFILKFRKGAGGRGLATGWAQNTANKGPQNCVPLLKRGDRKKNAEKRPESRANPFRPPTNPFSKLLIYVFFLRWPFSLPRLVG